MARPLVSDALWELIEPLIPKVPRRHRFPGRKRIDDRKVLTGILFVLRTGIPWEYLPQEMGCGSGMTCWRRLREWQEAGVWQRLHELLLAKLHEADLIDWSRAAIDSLHVRAFGGRKDRPEPGRPLTTRLQAPPDRLWPRHAADGRAHRRQPQRHHADDSARGRDPTGAWTARPSASPTEAALRRPRLPLTREGRNRAAPPAHPDEDRRSQEPTRLRTREAALGGRAHDRLAAPVSPPPRPLRACGSQKLARRLCGARRVETNERVGGSLSGIGSADAYSASAA
jgi:transposase